MGSSFTSIGRIPFPVGTPTDPPCWQVSSKFTKVCLFPIRNPDSRIKSSFVSSEKGIFSCSANNLVTDQINSATAKDFGLKQEISDETIVDDIDDLDEESVEESVEEEEVIEEVGDSYEQEIFEL